MTQTTPPTNTALTVHFDEKGDIIAADYPDGSRVTTPMPSIENEPMIGIDLLGVKTFDILRWRENGQEYLALHWFCRRFIELPPYSSQADD